VIEPLRIELDVACPPEQAFDLWTTKTSMWWPTSHTVSARSDVEIVIEPSVGGRIYERTPDGEEHDWGKVTVWEPPSRISYLWHLRQDRSDATEVQITFTPATPTGTRMSIEHRGWELLGARGADQRNRNERGWAHLLPHFKAADG
jgi:uncharacterized protein YndB with AHSA1/START domain